MLFAVLANDNQIEQRSVPQEWLDVDGRQDGLGLGGRRRPIQQYVVERVVVDVERGQVELVDIQLLAARLVLHRDRLGCGDGGGCRCGRSSSCIGSRSSKRLLIVLAAGCLRLGVSSAATGRRRRRCWQQWLLLLGGDERLSSAFASFLLLGRSGVCCCRRLEDARGVRQQLTGGRYGEILVRLGEREVLELGGLLFGRVHLVVGVVEPDHVLLEELGALEERLGGAARLVVLPVALERLDLLDAVGVALDLDRVGVRGVRDPLEHPVGLVRVERGRGGTRQGRACATAASGAARGVLGGGLLGLLFGCLGAALFAVGAKFALLGRRTDSVFGEYFYSDTEIK